MTARTIVLELARVEGAHLVDLVAQFAELIDDRAAAAADPAIARLVPDAYRDDPDASREFRRLTQSDLFDRRRDDAAAMLATLTVVGDLPDDPGDAAMMEQVSVRLDSDAAQAWLRTLAAVRLVLAARLGVDDEDSHDADDPRFGIYDWLGYRLQILVEAIDDSVAD